MVITSVITAVAALSAAVFSGLTLLFNGRRETRKWLRESLLEAQVAFLSASFAYPARRLRDEMGDLPADRPAYEYLDFGPFWARYNKAHAKQNDALTRIRLLADDAVVKAAEDLHDIDENISLRLLGDGEWMPEDVFEEVRLKQNAAREEFIRAARVGVKLSKGAAIRNSIVARDESLPADI